ncbi:glycosyltransferase family 4 protein [Shewanella sp. H8]|uniref:glycosyltransferase family 4 protein n=1 Tax=Shewanella sp. H8 TaxID=3342676 RepID=UPI003314C388
MFTKKIIFFAPILSNVGGIEKTALEIKNICENKNIPFDLITLIRTDNNSNYLLKNGRFFKSVTALFGKTIAFYLFTYFLLINNKEIISQLTGSIVLVRSSAMAFALNKVKKKNNIDFKLVYIPSHYSKDLFLPIIKRFYENRHYIKAVLNVRNMYSECYIEKKIIMNTDINIVTFSHNLKNRLTGNFKMRVKKNGIRVIRPGISTAILNVDPLKKTDSVNFLYVGRVEPGKNIDMLLDFFDRVKGLQCKLVIAGDGSLLTNLSKLYMHNKQIEFIGAIYGERLANEYVKASYLIIPSFNESYGHVISESLCCGTPVIGYYFKGCHNAIRELIIHGENGFVITDNTFFSFQTVIKAAMQNYYSFKKNAENIATLNRGIYSWNRFLEEVVK